MTRLLCFAAFLCAFMAPALARELDELQKGFMAKYDALNLERDQKLKHLSDGYLRVLQRLMDQAKGVGDLDKAVPIRDEITAIQKGGWPLQDLAEGSSAELGENREKYLVTREKIIGNHAQELVALAGKMTRLLKQEEVDLTKAGKIDQALSVKRMREALTEDAGLRQAEQITQTVVGGSPSSSGSNHRPPAAIAAQTFTFEGGTYYLFPEPMTPAQAADACKKIGGSLLGINSKTEYDHFHSYSVENEKPLWIDLQDVDKNRDWRHADGTKAGFLKWQSGEPNGGDAQTHVMIGYRGSWDMRDVNDTDRFHVICEW